MIPGISRTTKRRDPVVNLVDNNIGRVNPMDKVRGGAEKSGFVHLFQSSAAAPITCRTITCLTSRASLRYHMHTTSPTNTMFSTDNRDTTHHNLHLGIGATGPETDRKHPKTAWMARVLWFRTRWFWLTLGAELTFESHPHHRFSLPSSEAPDQSPPEGSCPFGPYLRVYKHRISNVGHRFGSRYTDHCKIT